MVKGYNIKERKYGLSALVFVVVMVTIVLQLWNETLFFLRTVTNNSRIGDDKGAVTVKWEQQQQQQQTQGTVAFKGKPEEAKVVNVELSKNATTTTTTRSQNVVTPKLQLLSPQQSALEFVLSRRKASEAAGLLSSWRWRGLGYLYENHNVVLMATVPAADAAAKVGETNSIKIYDVHPNKGRMNHIMTARSNHNNCHEFKIWVRVRGPEVLAGRATAVSSNTTTSTSSSSPHECHWTFDFTLNTPGEYEVDAKVLLYAPNSQNKSKQTNWMTSQDMNITKPEDLVEIFPLHAGFQGFKVYFPERDCQEFCTRLAPYCIYWASPAFWIKRPSRSTNGCEFFFRDDTPPHFIPQTHLLHPSKDTNRTISWELPQQLLQLQNMTTTTTTNNKKKNEKSSFEFFHGRPHNVVPPVHNYIGCGWSSWYTLDFPCLSGDLDDKVFMSNNTFTVIGGDDSSPIVSSSSSSSSSASSSSSPRRVGQPLCSVDIEMADRSKGRWVREAALPNSTILCPLGMTRDNKFSGRFDIIMHDPYRPHCWYQEDLQSIGKRCDGEMNCISIDKRSNYVSTFKKSPWYGVWKQDTCDYLEFTDDQLQQCITNRKIASIRVLGASLAEFLSMYLDQRLANIKLYNHNKDNNDSKAEGQTRFVKFDTLGLVHFCHESDVAFRERVNRNHPTVVREDTEHYIVTGPFASSEREIYVHADRIDTMNRIVQEVLEPKGYKFLEFFDMSTAFTYASATQMDGLHIIGPPMKMIVTKLFHYMCKDAVEGSVV